MSERARPDPGSASLGSKHGSAIPEVAIIVLNWNGLADLRECLASLMKLDYPRFRIVVVDNDSMEDVTPISNEYPDITLLRNARNLGYAAGNNVGIEYAGQLGCEFCWILNNDTAVEEKSLSWLVRALIDHPDVSAVTNLIVYYDDPSVSWFAGGVFRNGMPGHIGYFEPVQPQSGLQETAYLSGCSFLARTELLRKVGGFDEAYFCYAEDVDLSLRLRAAGGPLRYVPEAVVQHKVSRSTGNLSPIKLYYKHRNMLYLFRKFRFPWKTRLRWVASSLRFSLSLLIKHRRPAAASALIRAMVHGVTHRMGAL